MIRIAYAGNRAISVTILEFLLKNEVKPLALLLPEKSRASNSEDLEELCHYLDNAKIIRGLAFREKEAIDMLRELDLDYIISIHFPYILPKEMLAVPRHGCLNLHPSYLPYNKGWHTPSWAILEGTPFGATLHFMSESVDCGDIVHQKKIEVQPDDTADSLYKKVYQLEIETFMEAWPSLASGTFRRIPQIPGEGTNHRRMDLENIQKIDLENPVNPLEFLNKIRGLTTNNIGEAAYFEIDGKKYRVQLHIESSD